MSKTLIISYLPREGSNTAKIVKAFKAAAAGRTEITERKLDESGAVPLVDSRAMAAWLNAESNTDAEKASAELIAELKNADYLVIAAPLYNYGMPATLKTWVDLVTRAGATFKYSEKGPESLLKITKAAVITTTGATPIGQAPEFMTPHSRAVIELIAGVEASVIGAGSLDMASKDEVEGLVATASEQAAALAQEWFA